MKKLTPFLISSILLLGVAACDNTAKTSANAPTSTQQEDINTPDTKTVQDNRDDATSEIRRAQADADIRAREQRNNITGGDTERADADLASEVRSKLEVNITGGQLIVAAKDGAVTISGTVPNQNDLGTIEPLAKEIKGVKSVTNKAVVAGATPSPSTQPQSNN
ncbi:BON domain-containing protein [Phormidium nigroviride]